MGRFMRDVTDPTDVDAYAEWLAWQRDRSELVAEVARLFADCGPALPRPMRADLTAFVDGCSTRMLARCVAMNQDPDACEPFVAWRRTGACDPAEVGLRQEDFLDDSRRTPTA